MRYDEGTDHRSIQTAVIGSATSDLPIVLPPDYHDLERFRRTHQRETFWCGVLLGGCGKPLSDRRYRDRVCHFAHHRDPQGIPNTCQRRDTSVSSADHLYIRHGLTNWLKSRNHQAQASYPDLGSGPGGAVDLRLAGGRQVLRVQLDRQELREWEQAHAALSAKADHVEWLFGPDSALAHTQVARQGYALRVECETVGTRREVRIGTQGPDHAIDWTDLSQCRMTSAGIVTPPLARSRERERERERVEVRAPRSPVSFPLDAENVAFTDARVVECDLPGVDRYVVSASLQPAASTVVRALLALPVAIPRPRPSGMYALAGPAAVSPLAHPGTCAADWLVVAEGIRELTDETGDKWQDLTALRPTESPAVPGTRPAPAKRLLTEAQVVEGVRETLARAAGTGTRVRWRTISKKWKRTGQPFTPEAQVRLLVAVDAPREPGKPVLTTIVQGIDDGPVHLFGDVLTGLGWSPGMSRTMVEAIHKRELARAYAAHRPN
ncbi:hypothetical protein ACKI1Q_07080 [Streptomyces galilaeus]|uniref:hypothetical protein n=1 Tax=Streptomyces galilaeus TaxID=33899 RepID=UPI0038F71A92